MKAKKTKRYEIRLTEVEFAEIRKRAEKFNSISHFLHSAINEFSDSTIKDKMDARKHLSDWYVRADTHLAHIGGNLNQAMRRVNEASKVGHPTHGLIMSGLMPDIRECYKVCTELRKELMMITSKTVK